MEFTKRRLNMILGVVSPPDPDSFDWANAIINAGIMAAVAFISSLTTAITDGPLTIFELQVASLLAAGAFVGFLELKRNLKPTTTPIEKDS